MIGLLFPIFILCIVLLIKYSFSKKATEKEVFDGNFIKGCNALDLAYIYYHEIDISFIPSLLIHLANKGFLQIEESEDMDFKNDYKLTKLKIYDGNDTREKLFMNAIFKDNIDFISSKELKKNHYDIEIAARKIIETTKKKWKKIIEKKSWTLKNTIACFILLTWFFSCVYIAIKIGFGWFLFHLICLPIISYLLLQMGIIRFIQKRTSAGILMFFGILTAIITLTTLGNAVIVNSSTIVLPFFVSLGCIIWMDVIRLKIQCRSKEEENLYVRNSIIEQGINSVLLEFYIKLADVTGATFPR